MATRIETLGGARRAPRAAWIVLFAIVMVAGAVVTLFGIQFLLHYERRRHRSRV